MSWLGNVRPSPSCLQLSKDKLHLPKKPEASSPFHLGKLMLLSHTVTSNGQRPLALMLVVLRQ